MGESQDVLDEPEVRNAVGLPPIDTVVLRRQAGNIWASASGPGAGNANVIGAERDEGGANIEELGGVVVDVEGVEVNLVEAGVDAEYGEGGEGVVEVAHLPPRANARQAGKRQVEVEEVILGEQHHDGQGEGAGLADLATQVPPQLPPGADIPSLEQLHSTVVPTLKYCPKAARGDFARELATIWHRVTSQLDEERLWVLLGMFPRCILPAGRGPRAGDAYSQARLVRERLRRWRNGEYSQLWQEAVNLTKVPPKRRRRGRGGRQGEEKTQEMRNSERAKILAQEGQFTKALQALTSAGMADPDRTVLGEMEEKHPPAQGPPLQIPTTDLPQISFGQAEVEKAVRKFRRGSAPGPSGLRPEHLRVALQAAPGRRDRALQSLTQLVNAMAGGGVPERVAPFLAGARLHAAKKKSGGLRPIAVGNLLRRLVGKCCAAKVQDRAAGLLSPHQLGVGVRGACEAIVHSVKKITQSDPSLWVLQCDFINAFNLADRGVALAEVCDKFPELLAWVTTCYGQPSHLLFGSESISSQRGFHQGDPLASLLFSLILQPLILLLLERVPWRLMLGSLMTARRWAS